LDWDKVVDDDVPVSLYPNNKSTKIVNELEQPNTKLSLRQLENITWLVTSEKMQQA